jgi:predicted PhzF superfamily epimerase YddE/YHI9
VVQECGVGLVPVRIDGDALAFVAPSLIRSGPVADADAAIEVRAFFNDGGGPLREDPVKGNAAV